MESAKSLKNIYETNLTDTQWLGIKKLTPQIERKRKNDLREI